MRPDSIEFLILAIATIIVSRVGGGRWRLAAITLANILFLASFATDPASLLPLAGFVLAGYGAIHIAARNPGAGLLTGLVAAAIIIFIWLKRYPIPGLQTDLSFVYVTIGLSYVLFRVIHLTVDVSQGILRPPGPLSYLTYIFFFLSFSSGPVQRYQDFAGQLHTRAEPLSARSLTSAINRVTLGYFLLTVVDAGLVWVFDKLSVRLVESLTTSEATMRGLLLFLGTAPAYMLHVYANFSAYMHIVIGIGILVGIRLPENFNFPLAATSFLNFWARWHITLSEWFRDYMFNPLLRALLTLPLPSALAPYVAAIAFFSTFTVIGLWHGTSFAFIVLGLLFGTGASVNKLWQVAAPKLLGKQEYKSLCQRGWYLQTSRALTLSYIAVSLTCVWISPEGLESMLSGYGLVLATATMTLLFMAGIAICTSWNAASRIRLPQIGSEKTPLGAAAWSAAMIFVTFNLALAVNSASDILYKDF